LILSSCAAINHLNPRILTLEISIYLFYLLTQYKVMFDVSLSNSSFPITLLCFKPVNFANSFRIGWGRKFRMFFVVTPFYFAIEH
jgi:hypothetical protein